MMSYTVWLRSLASRCFLAVAGLALLVGLAPAPGLAGDLPGAVYVLSNQSTGNSVLVYHRAADGTLSFSDSFSTRGTGMGTGGDPLASQGAVVVGSELLFAVNAGSNDISMFRASGDKLVLLDKAPSGGQMPVSITVHGLLVYVLNAGGTPNISGFIIDPFRRRLIPLPNSRRPLVGGSAARPAEISFSAHGGVLLVTEKGTQIIDTYRVNFLGYASGPTSNPSSGFTPFGFSVTKRGYAIVSEAGSGAASSYDIEDNGKLELVSGSISLGQKAPCWLVTTSDGRYAYTANAGSNSIGSFSIASNGELTLLSGAAGSVSAPLDLGMTSDSQFLYVREGTGAVSGFHVERDGSLTFVSSVANIPPGAQGIAVR